MSDTTKQPLQIVDALVYRLSDQYGTGVNVDEISVTMWEGSRDSDSREQGSRRVKACLDACAGIPTGNLEQGGVLDTVIKQRDELLEAAIDVRSFVVGTLPTLGYLRDNDRSRAALEKLRIAIEKSEAAK